MAANGQIVTDVFTAFAAGDRERIEALLADELTFSSPPDPHLDRAGYFERCWPGAGRGQTFDITRLIEDGDEVVVTYEMTRADGARGRNTEVFTIADGRVTRIEVYFGWSVD